MIQFNIQYIEKTITQWEVRAAHNVWTSDIMPKAEPKMELFYTEARPPARTRTHAGAGMSVLCPESKLPV